MNTFALPKEKMLSIGWLDEKNLLKLAYPSTEYASEVFRGASVLDVGAGFSKFLEYIGENFEPEILTAVDPIFDRWKDLTAKYIQEFTQVYTEKAITDLVQSDTDTRKGYIDFMRQKSDVEGFSQKPNIQYFGDISQVPKSAPQDIIFVSSVLYGIDKPKKLLMEMDALLKPDGTIIMIDFMTRGDIYKKIQDAGIAIARTYEDGGYDRYFCAELKKGEYRKISEDPILILSYG